MNKRFAGFLIGSVLTAGFFSFHSDGAVPAGRYTLNATTAYDTKTKLTWQRVSSPARLTWASALAFCPNTYGAPWRLPTYKELFTLVDTASTTSPLFDTATFSYDPANTLPNTWSSTTVDATHSLIVVFSSYGGSSVVEQTSSYMYSVRCVR